MSIPIDELTIEIDAKAQNANSAIDNLCKKLDRLTTSLSKVDGSKITGLASGVQRLGTAMQTMNTIKTADFTRLATNLTKLGSVNVSALNSAASSMSHLTRAFNSLGTVSANATAVGDLAKNISKLGNKSVQTAVTNIPQLATALNGLMTTLSQAPSVSQNVIQMTNALANLTAQGSKVGSASNSIVNGLNKASTSATKANKSFKGLASTFGRFYANCFLVVRGVKALWESVKNTADYLEAFNYFEVALNKVGSDWDSYYEKYGYANAEAYANSFKTRLNDSLKGLSGVQISVDANGETGLLTDTGMKNLGLNIQEVTQYASQLASVTNSVGQTGEVTLATASAFTKLGADMSSLFNVDYKSVMNNLQSGLIGQSRALYKYGIDITNATLQTYAYGLGVEKAVSEMTQAEKMQLRMIAILDQSRVSWGDQANTINSLSNSIRQFKNNIKEAGMILGQLFVPILSKVMPIVNGLVIAIKRLMVSIAGLFGIKLDLSEFGQSTSGISDEIYGISDSLDDVSESAKKAKAGLRGFDELNVINTPSDSGGGVSGSVGGGLDLTDEILKATSEYEKAWQEAYERMQNKAEAFADKIAKALEPIKKIFKDISIGDWFAAGQDTSNLISGIFNFFADAIDKVDWEGIGKKIGDFLAGINWTDIFKSVGNFMWQGLKAAFELAIGMFESAPLETSLIALLAMPSVLNVLTGSKTIKGISKLVTNLGKFFTTAKTLGKGNVLKGLGGAMDKVRGKMSTLGKVSITAVTGLAEYGVVKSTFEDIAMGSENLVGNITKVVAAVGGAGTVISTVFGSAGLGFAVAGLTGLIGAFNGTAEAQRKLVENEQIAKYGDTIANITTKLNETNASLRNRADATMEYVNGAGLAEMTMASDLADRYFTLSEKANLTNEEKIEMKTLAEQLIELFPSLAEGYDEETGKINNTREAVENLIEQRLKEIQIEAAEDKLLEVYQQKIDAADSLADAIETVKTAQEESNALNQQYQDILDKRDLLTEYDALSAQINATTGDATDLLEKQREIWSELTSNGEETFPTYESLSQQLANTQTEIDNFKQEYDGLIEGLIGSNEEYNNIENNISTLTNMITSGYQDAGEGAVESFAGGLESGVSLVEEANSLIANAGVGTIQDINNSNSPSKVYEDLGKDAVDGYNLGFTNNQDSTISTVSEFAQNSINEFRSAVSVMYEIGRDMMQGLYNGIASSEDVLYAKMQSIADTIAKTTKTALEIHSPSRVMTELGEYTIAGFKQGMENLYQPTLASLKNFTYNVEVAPNLTDMYSNYQPAYANAYTPSYADIGYLNAGNQENNIETNALLRELLTAVRQGRIIQMNGREVARQIQKEDASYFGRTGNGMFQH